MAEYKQKNRILSFKSPLGPDKLLALSFHGTEGISELFSYQAELLVEPEVVVKASAIVGKRVTMTLDVGGGKGKYRYFNGVVASLEAAGGNALVDRYSVHIVPAMWMLSLSRQTRVFQDKTVVEIVRNVLEPYSIVPRVETRGRHVPLEYCTQYRETDLEFVERILEKHGIFFYFIHTVSDHTLVLSDTSNLCSECPITNKFDFQNDNEGAMDFYKPVVYDFRSKSTLISGEHTSWDYRFMPYAVSQSMPRTARSNTEMGNNRHELSDFADSATSYFKTEQGDSKSVAMQTHLQSVERDASDAESVQCRGQGTANTMQAGFSFLLNKHPQAENNVKYLLTSVEHSISQWPPYHAEELPEGTLPYRNTFEARPFTQVFRKRPRKTKPRVNGVVTGKVVTFPGKDSYLDKFGRVCVQFWWDRETRPQRPDKTLLRVAQQWAGKGWGTYFWPRVGDEVLIDFIEGDPDAPIVVGSLYNGVNLPKYDPKSEYTRSGILTRSSENGVAANANELRFDDRKGSEQIFVNAERDLDVHVEHDRHTRIDNQEHHQVADDHYMSVGGSAQQSIFRNQLLDVVGNRNISVRGIQTETIGPMLSTEVAGVQTSKTGGAHIIQAGGLINVEAQGALILQSKGVLYLSVNGVGLAITAPGLAILAALGVGQIGPPPPIPPIATPPPSPRRRPEWPGDD